MDEKEYAAIQYRKKKRRAVLRKKRKTAAILFLLFCCIFAVSGGKLAAYFQESRKQENAFAKLEQIVETTGNTYDTSLTNLLNPQILPQYQTLYEQNPNLWGWIKIDETSLSYPVMYTPEDSEYYLSRDFAGNPSASGVPFLAGECTEDCGNYIIYGHNMKNGKMFAPIVSYAKEDFYKEHPVILLDTLYEHRSYSVIAAFYSKAYYQEDTNVFRYYQYTDLRNPETFDEYIKQVKEAAIYETDTDVQFGDELLTLSTCSYHSDNGRFVVVAKKN